MFTKPNGWKFVVVLCLALASTLTALPTLHADEGNPRSGTALVWSSGMLDVTDNTVLYSITLAAGHDALKNAVLNAELPIDATFIDVFWTPATATFEGERDGSVTWSFAELPAQTFYGPFTVRVKFEDTDFNAPGGINAKLSFDGGTVEALLARADVTALEVTSSIEITPEGTHNNTLVEVGKTGIMLMIPAGTVSENVTLTFTHIPITDDLDLPELADAAWWCGLVSITADKEVTFAQPIFMVLPNRKAITPNSLIPVFWKAAGAAWVQISDGTPKAVAYAVTNVFGNKSYIDLSAVDLGIAPQYIAIGIEHNIRANGQSTLVTRPSGKAE